MSNWENNYYINIKNLNVKHYAGETSYYSTAKLRAAEKALLSKLKKNSKILDVGCGSGRFSINAAKLGFKVLGVDITPEAIEVCKQRAEKENLQNTTDFKVLDITEEALTNEQFDYVFCPRFVINAISTSQRRKKAIKNMYRSCKKGGCIYIESFNIAYLGRGPITPIKNIVLKFYRHSLVFLKNKFKIPYKGLLPGDIVYTANKAKDASEGYAHLPTFFEIKNYVNSHKTMSIYEIINKKKDFLKPFRYSIWAIDENVHH